MRILLRTLFVIVALTGTMAVSTSELCAECSRYNFDTKDVSNEALLSMRGWATWTGGTKSACEQKRQEVQAAMDRLYEKAREAQQKATLAHIAYIGSLSESERARTKAAYDQAKKAADQADAVAPRLFASPGQCNCMFDNSPDRPSSGNSNTGQAPSRSSSDTPTADIKSSDSPEGRTPRQPARPDSETTDSRDTPATDATDTPTDIATTQGTAPQDTADDELRLQRRIAADRDYVLGRLSINAEKWKQLAQDEQIRKGTEATRAKEQAAQVRSDLAAVPDAYGGLGSKPLQQAEVVGNPYAKDAATSSKAATSDPLSKKVADKYEELLDRALGGSADTIAKRRKAVEGLLVKARPGSKDAVAMERFVANSKTTEQLASGLGALFKAVDYGQSIKDVVDTKIPEEHRSAWGELYWKVTKDVAEGGLPKVAQWLWSKEAGEAITRVFEGAWATTGGILLDSVETGHPWLVLPAQKVIMDSSNAFSIEAKREAMDNYFRAYVHNGQNWSKQQFADFVNSIEYLSRVGSPKIIRP